MSRLMCGHASVSANMCGGLQVEVVELAIASFCALQSSEHEMSAKAPLDPDGQDRGFGTRFRRGSHIVVDIAYG